MSHIVEIEQLMNIEVHLNELSNMLIKVVEEGASMGFLPSMSNLDASNYWKKVLNADVVLLVAKIKNRIVGTVQLQLSTKQNGNHRAEVAKLMIDTEYRRMGIGRLLMQKAEEIAKDKGKSLIVLDTREGDPSNKLYISLCYIQAGRIPDYAQSMNGELDATIIYYKNIK